MPKEKIIAQNVIFIYKYMHNKITGLKKPWIQSVKLII